jgi:hypothetical protein
MEIEIRIRGSESEIGNFMAENRFLEPLLKAGKISTEISKGWVNPKMFDAIYELSWWTIHFAHIILIHGHEDNMGRYVTKDELLGYKLNSDGEKFESDRNPSARVGGAKRVSHRCNLPEILKIKRVSGEKRYYLTPEAMPSLEQVINTYNNYYREFLEGEGYFYPGEEM